MGGSIVSTGQWEEETGVGSPAESSNFFFENKIDDELFCFELVKKMQSFCAILGVILLFFQMKTIRGKSDKV